MAQSTDDGQNQNESFWLKYGFTILSILCVVVLLVVYLWFCIIDKQSWPASVLSIVANLLASAIGAAFVNTFLAKRTNRQFTALISNALAMKGALTKLLDPNEQHQTLVDLICLRAGLNDQSYAQQLFDIIVNQNRYRRNLQYKVVLRAMVDGIAVGWGPAPGAPAGEAQGPSIFLGSDHYWICETSLNFDVECSPEWIGHSVYGAVCFSPEQLEQSLNDPLCIFREKIYLEPEEGLETAISVMARNAQWLKELPREVRVRSEQFVGADPGALNKYSLAQPLIPRPTDRREIFRASCILNRGILGEQLAISYDPKIGLKYGFKVPSALQAGKTIHIDWTIVLPISKRYNYFPVVFGVPTHLKEIQFDASIACGRLEWVNALTTASPTKFQIGQSKPLASSSEISGTLEISLGELVLAKSGVLFWWPNIPFRD